MGFYLPFFSSSSLSPRLLAGSWGDKLFLSDQGTQGTVLLCRLRIVSARNIGQIMCRTDPKWFRVWGGTFSELSRYFL